MVATIYGNSQAQLSERLGFDMRCDARFTADIKKPRITRHFHESHLSNFYVMEIISGIASRCIPEAFSVLFGRG
ncbi:hypothetical protein XX58_002193 [Salmonella enterica subsp. salamae]|uniref:Uncharacterized protein n=2 Tax=Salmonella enterica TaxID=28901 RepID=A0A603KZ24_SALER|nr:hypothetical protein [Salmonella enterica subsp. salamae]EAM3923852.1 hypothetical protein [Salmonella enterica]EBP3808933.1 hypothetical protein [Salmonella enterica subsp. enterica]EDX4960622.1 hypothetical protein [Salmonella enterica subsp. salamae serovar 58:l,z13,z28:z6]EAN9125235.1 hypothetical protein [Salmonella enterica]